MYIKPTESRPVGAETKQSTRRTSDKEADFGQTMESVFGIDAVEFSKDKESNDEKSGAKHKSAKKHKADTADNEHQNSSIDITV